MAPLVTRPRALFVSALLLSFGQRAHAQCNPLQGACPAIPGLVNSTYSVDFTLQSTTPADWIQANYETVRYGSNGAEFTLAKQGDAPYIWTNFYILFGRVEVVMQAAPGTGVISSAVLLSDDLDEIDWEFSGNNFAHAGGRVQTNYFGKGITGNYDRGTTPSISDPTQNFHTYTLDWSNTQLTWSVDGTAVRTLPYSGATSGSYQYPQSPMRLHLGLWDAGDPNGSPGVVGWAGGYTNLTKLPYTAYAKSVKITTSNPCSSYIYDDKIGTYQSITCENATLPATTSSSSSSSSLSSTSNSSRIASSPTSVTLATPSSSSSSTVTSKSQTAVQSSNSISTSSVISTIFSTNIQLPTPINSTQGTSSSSTVSEPSSSACDCVCCSSSTAPSKINTPSNTPVSTSISSPTLATTSFASTSTKSTASASAPVVIPLPNSSSSAMVASSSVLAFTTPNPTATPPPSCNQDNCLRNVLDPRYIASMITFCSGLLGPATASADIPQVPPFLGNCQNNLSRINSACKCLPTSTSMATVFTPGAHKRSGVRASAFRRRRGGQTQV